LHDGIFIVFPGFFQTPTTLPAESPLKDKVTYNVAVQGRAALCPLKFVRTVWFDIILPNGLPDGACCAEPDCKKLKE
jgi:hypothetical protein